jgi:acyl-CoA hydrolase
MRVVTEAELTRELGRYANSTPRVVASGNFATPRRLLGVVDETIQSYRLFVLNAQHPLPRRRGVSYETPFIGPAMRGEQDLSYLPIRLSMVPRLFERSRPPDVLLIHTSVPQSGMVSLGIEVNILVAALQHIRREGGLVVAQMNPRMPYTFGDGEIRSDYIDLAIEVDEALPSPEPRPKTEVTAAIATNVARFVPDGATLQLGIGAIPDCVLDALVGRLGLAIWSEMISDGVLHLEHHGAMDRARPIVASFMFGSEELYGWADRNPRVHMARTELTNDPAMIARQPYMTSINTAIEVDLFAQANASYVRGRIYSGFGGQSDFTVGAMHAMGGHALIALPSWHRVSQRSTIVAALSSPVTSFQHSAIVTEQGCAEIFGHSQREQAALIIDNAAHPEAHGELRESAGALRPGDSG